MSTGVDQMLECEAGIVDVLAVTPKLDGIDGNAPFEKSIVEVRFGQEAKDPVAVGDPTTGVEKRNPLLGNPRLGWHVGQLQKSILMQDGLTFQSRRTIEFATILLDHAAKLRGRYDTVGVLPGETAQVGLPTNQREHGSCPGFLHADRRIESRKQTALQRLVGGVARQPHHLDRIAGAVEGRLGGHGREVGGNLPRLGNQRITLGLRHELLEVECDDCASHNHRIPHAQFAIPLSRP